MSSGLPDLFRSPRFWAEVASIRVFPDFWPHFAHAPLAFEPGTKGAYSNSNFLILGAVIERRLGRPFIEIVEERIFRATDMTSTGYRSSAFRNAAVGYTRRPAGSGTGTAGDSGQWHRASDDPFAANKPSAPDDAADCLPCSPMGGGYSTARDLARSAGAVMERRLLGPDMTRHALAGHVAANEYPGEEGYGFETRLVGGVRIAGHRGGFRGIANRVEFYPDLGYVVVVLGNTDGDGAETIAAHVRTQIAASPILTPSAMTSPRQIPPTARCSERPDAIRTTDARTRADGLASKATKDRTRGHRTRREKSLSDWIWGECWQPQSMSTPSGGIGRFR